MAKQNKALYIKISATLLEHAKKYAKDRDEAEGVSGMVRRMLAKKTNFKES